MPVRRQITCLSYRSGDPHTHPLGLGYLIGRYYDPGTGQFLSVDPVVEQTQAAFEYAGDDPVNASDPSGLFVANQCEAPGTIATCNKGGRNPLAPLMDAYNTVNNALNGVLGQIDQGATGFLRGNGAFTQCGSLGVGDQFACDIGVTIGAALELGGGAEGDPPDLNADLKVHGNLPEYPPRSWTTEQLEQLRSDLEKSIDAASRTSQAW